jgi:hypothetical protein
MRCLDANPIRRPRHACSGQVITEAAIGLALMTFAWILMSYSCYMGTNAIRTCMASRHAAWLKGATGNTPSPEQIDQNFFFQTGLSKVESLPPVKIADLFTDSASKDQKGFGGKGQGPFLVKVSYGVSDLDSATQFPFDLLKAKVPFMPALPTNVLSVNSSCEWEETSDTWNTAGQAVSGVLDTLKSLIPFPF